MTENTDGYNSKYGRLAFEKATENQKKLAMIEKNGAVTEDDEITFSETFVYPEQKCVKYIRFYANREIVKITVSVTSANAVGARAVLNGKCVFEQNPLNGKSFSVSAVCRSGENKLYIDFGENLQKFDVNVSLCGRVKKLEDVALPGYALNDCFSVLCEGKLSLYMYGEGVFTECRSFYGVETGSATYNSSDGLFYIAVRYVTGKNAIYTYDKKLNKVALFDDTLVFKNVAFCFTNNLYLYYASCGALKVAKCTESGFVTQVFSCKANKFHCSHNYGGSYLYVGNVYGFYTAYKIGDDGAPVRDHAACVVLVRGVDLLLERHAAARLLPLIAIPRLRLADGIADDGDARSRILQQLVHVVIGLGSASDDGDADAVARAHPARRGQSAAEAAAAQERRRRHPPQERSS